MVHSCNFLLLMLAAIITGPAIMVSANHKNDCVDSSDAGNYFVNFCEEKCVCEETAHEEWAFVCYRQREEFTCMPTERRELFLDTFKAVTTPGHPQYDTMRKLITLHGDDFNEIHTPQFFLPWHRYYAMAVEDVLRNEDCRVTLPWWQWSRRSAEWWTGTPFLPESNWLGTDSNVACVDDGAFAWPGWQPSAAGGCLRRNFWLSPMPSVSLIGSVLDTPPNLYNVFSETVDNGPIHGTPHALIGGDMADVLSPREPTFFLHHGYVDQLWDRWQKKSPAHLTSYSSWDPTAELTSTFGSTPKYVNDHFDLKASGVIYVHLKANPIGPSHACKGGKKFRWCHVHVCRYSVFSAENTKLQKQRIFDGGRIEGVIMNNLEAMRQVPQLRPVTPSIDELMKRFSWMLHIKADDNAETKENKTKLFQEKIQIKAELNAMAADRVENPISPEDLAKLDNPASRAMGLDFDSDEFTQLLLENKICQEGWEFDDSKGECKENKESWKALKKEIRQKWKIVGSEIYPKKDAPKPTNPPTPEPTESPKAALEIGPLT